MAVQPANVTRRGLLAGTAATAVGAVLLDGVPAAHASPYLKRAQTFEAAVVTLAAPAFVPYSDGFVAAAVPVPVGSEILAADVFVTVGTDALSATIEAPFLTTPLTPQRQGSGTVVAPVEYHTLSLAGIEGERITTDSALQIVINLPPLLATVHGARVRYIPPGGSSAPAFIAGPSQRIYDSRESPLGRLQPDEERIVGVPFTPSTRSAVLNLTATESDAPGYLAVYSSGVPWPGTSSLNWSGPNQNVANLVIVRPNAGAITVRGGASPVHFIVDYVGSLG